MGTGSRSLHVDEIKPVLDWFKPQIDPIDPSMNTGHTLSYAGHPVLQGRLPLFQSRNPSFQITHVVDHPIEFLVEPTQHRQNYVFRFDHVAESRGVLRRVEGFLLKILQDRSASIALVFAPGPEFCLLRPP